MRTDELIRAMAADDTQTKPVRLVLPFALAAAALIGAVAYFVTMGPRPDFLAAYGRLIVLMKQAFPVIMAFAALGAVLRLSQPGGRLDGTLWTLLLAPVVVAAVFWTTASTMPMAEWGAAIHGESFTMCLSGILTIGAPILVASLLTLRRGASTRPRLTGAMAGLLSGAVAGAIYAIYCTEDSPMFWAVWYSAAMLVMTAVGALLGPRLLRW